MKRKVMVHIAVLLTVIMATCCFAEEQERQEEELERLLTSFYNDIARIINDNMDDPDECLKRVDDYYKDNEDKVEKIRALSEEYMTKLASMLGEYEDIGGDWEIIDYEIEYEILEKTGLARTQPFMNYETTDYSIALKKFSSIYPHHGSVIAKKALEFTPIMHTDSVPEMPEEYY